MGRQERLAGRVAAAEMVTSLWKGIRGRVEREVEDAERACDEIVDGIEGVMSERGESGVLRYWKRNVLMRWRKGKRAGWVGRELWELLEDLVDGLEGYVSETGDEGPFWKVGVLEEGRRASLRLLALIRRGA